VLAACSTRFRGLPHTEAVKRALATGLVGRPYALRFQTAWSRSRAGIEYQPQSRWFLDSGKPRLANVWGGMAEESEFENIERWALGLGKNVPRDLARCFAWYVVRGRSLDEAESEE